MILLFTFTFRLNFYERPSSRVEEAQPSNVAALNNIFRESRIDVPI